MNIKCLNQKLQENINLVIKAVSTKTTMEILEYILIVAKDGELILVANDLEMAIETNSIDAEILEEGSVALEAKMFNDIIRKLPHDKIVSLSSDSNNVTTINCDLSEFKILGLSGEDFPTLPFVEKSNYYKISSNEFKNLIKKTIFSVAQDESKPVLTGELLEIKDDAINVVAVDGFRVAFCSAKMESSNGVVNLVIPSKTLNEISKILPQDEECDIMIYYTDKHVLFEVTGCTIVSRLLDGDFIKYEQIFTEDYKTLVTINKADFILGLERASIIASKEIKKSPVKLKIENQSLLITSNTQVGTVKEELSVDVEGDNLEIAFNPRYLIDAVKSIDENIITIQFNSNLSPCIIKPVGNQFNKYLILPLRLE